MSSSSSCITLASYNMHKAVGLDGRRDPHRVLRVLQEIDADIVALQEADKRIGGRGSTVPHELIDSHGLYKPVHLGVRHKRVFDKARRHTDRLLNVNTRNIGWHGNAILVKRHIGVLDCAALDLPMLEPRGAVMAELLIDEKPLRVIGMHESTVSRATSNKYLLCDRGLFELKYFFGSGVASAEGDGAAAEAVKAAIKELIEAESDILSDDAIAALLKQRGFDCARRTVVKYRESMGIGSSIQRRRQRKISGG